MPGELLDAETKMLEEHPQPMVPRRHRPQREGKVESVNAFGSDQGRYIRPLALLIDQGEVVGHAVVRDDRVGSTHEHSELLEHLGPWTPLLLVFGSHLIALQEL